MRNYPIITEEKPHSSISEQYRKLRTNIDFSSFNKELKVLNITSTFPEEGKSITCLNLATVYAQSNQKTLLIDLDLRKPKIHRAFNVTNTDGISTYTVSDCNIKEKIIHVNDYLDILTSGPKVPFPSELLGSMKIKDMLEELKKDYNKIIIDSPPLTAVTDATIISSLCDGTIFVVAAKRTNSTVATRVLKQLKDSGVNIIGGVLTRVSLREAFYGIDYNYYYGEEK